MKYLNDLVSMVLKNDRDFGMMPPILDSDLRLEMSGSPG